MKETRLLMGMPIMVEVVDPEIKMPEIDQVFDYFKSIEDRFSVYKNNSEISRFNQGKISYQQLSSDMKLILQLADDTKSVTRGYFDIRRADGLIDPSGIVKGWAIYNAAKLIEKMGYKNYYVDAGGDIQVKGKNNLGKPWRIGIRNPFNRYQNIKVLSIGDRGVATSGTYIRGQHVHDPFQPKKPITEIVSLTVVGPNVYEADRFATAAFAMRDKGVNFIATLSGFEAYSVDSQGIATFTDEFTKYVVENA